MYFFQADDRLVLVRLIDSSFFVLDMKLGKKYDLKVNLSNTDEDDIFALKKFMLRELKKKGPSTTTKKVDKLI